MATSWDHTLLTSPVVAGTSEDPREDSSLSKWTAQTLPINGCSDGAAQREQLEGRPGPHGTSHIATSSAQSLPLQCPVPPVTSTAQSHPPAPLFSHM